MKRIVFIVCLAVAVACAAGCTNASKSYVNKAVKIMDKNGLYAVGEEWEKARKEALEANPLTLEEAHRIADAAERAVRDGLGVQLVIHADPVSENDPVIETTKKELETVISRLDPSLAYHDFRVIHGKSHINLVFDLVLPYSYDASRQETLVQELKAAMQKKNPRYHCHITCDRK